MHAWSFLCTTTVPFFKKWFLCFGTTARLPNIEMFIFSSFKNLHVKCMQSLCLGTMSPNSHHHNFYETFVLRGSTEYFPQLYIHYMLQDKHFKFTSNIQSKHPLLDRHWGIKQTVQYWLMLPALFCTFHETEQIGSNRVAFLLCNSWTNNS